MSKHENPFEPLFDGRQHNHYAKLVGSYMVGVIRHGAVTAVNRRSIETGSGFNTAVDRWSAALRLLSCPRPGIPGAEDLSSEEISRIQRASEKRPGVNELARTIKNERLLREPLRGFHNFADTNTKYIDDLLCNGVIDTARWLEFMQLDGIEPDEMRTHPLFLVATSFKAAGHTALSGAIQERLMAGSDNVIPTTRLEATQAIDQASTFTIALARSQAGAANPEEMMAPGFCPAGRMRDEQGTAWVYLLVNQGVDLLAAMPPH